MLHTFVARSAGRWEPSGRGEIPKVVDPWITKMRSKIESAGFCDDTFPFPFAYVSMWSSLSLRPVQGGCSKNLDLDLDLDLDLPTTSL